MWKTYRFPEDGEKRLFRLKSIGLAVRVCVRLFRAKIFKRPPVKIFFATETGVSKVFAGRLRKLFLKSFNVTMIGLDQ